MKPILLEKSDSNILENKRSNSNRTPDQIKRELDKALKDGFNTFYGGSFLLIPYLLQLGILEKNVTPIRFISLIFRIRDYKGLKSW